MSPLKKSRSFTGFWGLLWRYREIRSVMPTEHCSSFLQWAYSLFSGKEDSNTPVKKRPPPSAVRYTKTTTINPSRGRMKLGHFTWIAFSVFPPEKSVVVLLVYYCRRYPSSRTMRLHEMKKPVACEERHLF